jgi:FkbM family methyltransferase
MPPAEVCPPGECCELETRFLLNLTRRGGMVVEVGANMGIHTVPLAQTLAAQGRQVLAFDPQRVFFRQFCANLPLNGLTNALSYACGAEAGVVTFAEPNYRPLGDFGGISMETAEQVSQVRVPCVRVDDVVNTEHVGPLKVGVECFELKALQGAASTVQRCRPLLYLENDRLDRSRELLEWIWAAGHKLWWHKPLLFNPENFFQVAANLYSGIASFNMLGVPREVNTNSKGMEIVVDSSSHPLTPK